jgi:inner membrane protein
MDPLTHALASYTLKRAAFPRAARNVTIAMLFAGTIADLDVLSAYFGPSAFLTFHRTYFHSVLAALLLALLISLVFHSFKHPPTQNQIPLGTIFAPAAAALLHLLMDLCQSAGIELLWPFSPRRFSLDWLAHLDLWILAILLVGLLLPLLSGLVTEEIGAKSKGPKGKVGASLALAVLILYISARAVLHSSAIAVLESRTYHGEPPRRTAAFAESASPFRWHGIIETESALHDVEVEVGPGASFDPETAITSYKPEPSPALEAARNAPVAHLFLQTARFPKASVEKTTLGFHIILHTFPYNRDASSGWRVEALIDIDPTGKILSQELVWEPASREFWWK